MTKLAELGAISLNSFLKNVATLGFIGYLPIAPGTFGSLVALIFFGVLKPSLFLHVLLFLAVTVLGTIASHEAEKILNEKDSGHIVIDECAGYAVSIFLLPMTLGYLVAAFLLFRFFDILKPLPIRKIEMSLPGGVGVMADDIVAGIYTNIVLQIWMLLT